MTAIKNLKQNALQSAAYDTVLQVCLRIVSFILNSIIVRNIGTSVFAICSVRLLLLYSTTLLLTREALRRAALAAKHHQINYELVNLLWTGCVALVPVGTLLSYVWCSIMATPPEDVLPVSSHYTMSVLLMLLCCTVELLAEVPFVLVELQLWCKTRVIIEGVTQLVRSVLIAMIVLFWPAYAVLGYCICHLIGSCVYTCSYYLVLYQAMQDNVASKHLPMHSLKQLLPTWTPGSWLPPVQQNIALVARGFFVQCWLKELLTEGEWFMMNLLPLVSLMQQGTYQVVSNLGALGPRLVFRSIETAAYKYFAQTLQRGIPVNKQDRVSEAAHSLQFLLRGLLLLGLMMFTFGWSYSALLLQLYGGTELSTAGTGLLRAQCALLLLLALNGGTEAYTFSVMTDTELFGHSALLVVCSVCYLALCAALSSALGAIGFVLANCVNMTIRILHGWHLIHRQYTASPHRPLHALLLPPSLIAGFAAAFAATAASENLVYPRSALLHVAVGGCSLLVVLYTLRHECRTIYVLALRKADSVLNKVPLIGGAAEHPAVHDRPSLKQDNLGGGATVTGAAAKARDVQHVEESQEIMSFRTRIMSAVWSFLYGADDRKKRR